MQFIDEEKMECFACKYIAKTKTNFKNHLYTMRHHNNVKKLQQQQEQQEEQEQRCADLSPSLDMETDTNISDDTESVSDVTDSLDEVPADFEPEVSRRVKAHEGYLASSLFCEEDAFSSAVANLDKVGMTNMENILWGIAVCMMMTGSFMIGGALAKMQC